MVNGTNYGEGPTRKQAEQARTMFKVLVFKGMEVPEMAGVIGHMGALLVEWAKEGKIMDANAADEGNMQ